MTISVDRTETEIPIKLKTMQTSKYMNKMTKKAEAFKV
jgi:hypothetical protein